MLITQIDIKTGKVLQQPNPETLQLEPKQKLVGHSYLEAWLKRHGLENAAFLVGEFYAGVDEHDRLRLEEDGKVLVFANGKKGYFTDPNTAQLMIQGDREIQPIYVQDENAAHNAIGFHQPHPGEDAAKFINQSIRNLVRDFCGFQATAKTCDDRIDML